MSDHDDNKFWFGFFLGGILGAIVLFFVGTKEGKKTGKVLQTRGEDLIDTIQERLEELKDKGRELAKEGEELKEQVMEKFDDRKDKLTKDVTQKIDTALAHIEEIQEHGRETTASIRKAFKNLPKKS
jgi:gas vesicle protein